MTIHNQACTVNGQLAKERGRPMREAKGCTVRLVPKTMSRSALEKSDAMYWKKRCGKLSPKNTMSGFTKPSA